MLVTFQKNQQRTLLKMKPILLFLFLGASVALDELPCTEEVPGALADEENDPFKLPSLPPVSVGSV